MRIPTDPRIELKVQIKDYPGLLQIKKGNIILTHNIEDQRNDISAQLLQITVLVSFISTIAPPPLFMNATNAATFEAFVTNEKRMCDSQGLGYELGLIELSITTLLSEILIKDKNGQRVLGDHYGAKPGNKKDDIPFHELIVALCKIEGVWSFAVEEYILCSLSRTFFFMKFHYYRKPDPFDPELPEINNSNRKIYQQQAKYLKILLTNNPYTLWRSTVLDIFYFSLQHSLFNAHSIAYSRSLTSPSIFSSPQTTIRSSFATPSPKNALPQILQAPKFAPSPLHNVCHTLRTLIPKYTGIFLESNTVIKCRKGIPREVLRAYNELPKEIHNACNSAKPAPFPSPLQNHKGPSLSNSSTSPPHASHLPLISSHSTLAFESFKRFPNLHFTYQYYYKEISSLQKHLSKQLSITSKNTKALIPLGRRLLALLESINLSIFSISVFCGPESYDALIDYSLHKSPLAFVNYRSGSLEPQQEFLSSFLRSINLKPSTAIFSISQQLDFLQSVSNCAYNNLLKSKLTKVYNGDTTLTQKDKQKNNMSTTMLESSYNETINKQKENSYKAILNQWLASDLIKATNMRNDMFSFVEKIPVKATMDVPQWTRFMQTIQNNDEELSHWKKIAELAYKYSLYLHRWIDLEKLYRFPLGHVLVKGSYTENDTLVNSQLYNDLEKDEVNGVHAAQLLASLQTKKLIKGYKRKMKRLQNTKLCPSSSKLSSEQQFCNSNIDHREERSRISNLDKDKLLSAVSFFSELDKGGEPNSPVDRRVDEEFKFLQNSPQWMANSSVNIPESPSLSFLNGLPLKSPRSNSISVLYSPLPNFYNSHLQSSLSPPRCRTSFFDPPIDLDTQFNKNPANSDHAERRRLKNYDDVMQSSLLPFAYNKYSRQEAEILQNNIVDANDRGGLRQEMQFWLLVNHHPSEISSCFSYTISESRDGEIFNSSLSLPNSLSLYVTSVSVLQNTYFVGMYGWKEMMRYRDYRLEELLPLVELLKQQQRYKEMTEQQHYSEYHTSEVKRQIQNVNKILENKSIVSNYSKEVQMHFYNYSLASLQTAAISAFQNAINYQTKTISS